MKKKIIMILISLTFIIIFTTSISAQFVDLGFGYSALLSSYLGPADWQLEYIQPLEPGELEKGEYRISPIIAGANFSNQREVLSGTNDPYDYENTITSYGVVFDTAFSDSFTLHGKYIYQPWTEIESENGEIDEDRVNLLDLFMNYKIDDDKKLYFGYNRILDKEKEFDSAVLEFEDEDITNIYFIGFELRGKFTGNNE